jgi:hypothetical protein
MISITSLPFPKYQPKKATEGKEVTLWEDLILEQWIVAKGEKIKILTGRDFGYVVLQDGQKDKRGFTIPRKLFRY